MNPIITQDLAGYSPISDIIAMILCITMTILVYMSRSKSRTSVPIIFGILIECFGASACNIIFQQELVSQSPSYGKIYFFRALYHLLVTFVLLLYSLYLYEPLWISHRAQRRNMIISTIAIFGAILYDTFGTVLETGYYILPNGELHQGINAYIIVFSLLWLQIVYLLIKHRSRLLRQVFTCLISMNCLTLIMLFAQESHHNVSYTTLAYFIPIIGIIFLFHSNPFDISTGAMSEEFFLNEMEQRVSKNHRITILLCKVRGFSDYLKNSKEFRSEYYHFLRSNVSKGVLYSFSGDRLVLTLKNTNNDKTKEAVAKMLGDFIDSYSKFKLEYKVVILSSSQDITHPVDYLNLLNYVEEHLPFNQIHHVTSEDIRSFYNNFYILNQLEDIAKKNDLADERVLVFCQPIYNIATGGYDTAEALMRLKLEKTGMVFPDQFIPLAEENNLIHTLSLIIMDKTCAAIRDLMEENYNINRISVNFTTADLRYDSFCEEVRHIIERNGIPYDHIAIEITESSNDADFNLIKERVMELQKLGVKFYLDDFGTGYSNFERIMEIPFNIIKFDRSMLIEHAKSESSRYMVNTFADMFNRLKYTVLFEGVENETDQENCMKMNAKYLQGYKFSRPIPIEKLREFLTKTEPVEVLEKQNA